MLGVIQSPPRSDAVARLSVMPNYNALLRTTCVATMVNAGHAENALPQTATAIVNCRILPGEDPVKIKELLFNVVAVTEVSVEPVNPSEPRLLSPTTPDVL